MIPFNFEYYQPNALAEAIELFASLDSKGRSPKYFAGGTEIITMSRTNNLWFDAVIDIKQIPECLVLQKQEHITLGAVLTLSQVIDSDVFHLLSLACQRIADHTAQQKITLGGNIAGTIIYHESALPMLAADCRVKAAGPMGVRELALEQILENRSVIEKGELLMQFIMPAEFAGLPSSHVKHTESEKIGYPVLSAAAIKTHKTVRMAFSGISDHPLKIEVNIENEQGDISNYTLANAAMDNIPKMLLSDTAATSAYREYLLNETILNILDTLNGAN